MPIYEYTCLDCNKEFELLRSIKDADASSNCVHCQSEHIQRKISLFNASSGGRTLTNNHTCSGCAGGSCSSCGSH